MPFSGGSSISGSVVVTSGTLETQRDVTAVTLTIANGASVSDALDMRGYAGGVIYIPATWTAADLGIQVCETIGGTYHTLLDRSGAYGTDVSIDGPAANGAYPLPPYAFGAHFMRLFSHDGAGAAQAQGAERSIVVMLKS